jgi:hypothetical protein
MKYPDLLELHHVVDRSSCLKMRIVLGEQLTEDSKVEDMIDVPKQRYSLVEIVPHVCMARFFGKCPAYSQRLWCIYTSLDWLASLGEHNVRVYPNEDSSEKNCYILLETTIPHLEYHTKVRNFQAGYVIHEGCGCAL